MNKSRAEAAEFFSRFSVHMQSDAPVSGARVIVCPPYLALDTFAHFQESLSGVELGAQNVHGAKSGAFTGEVSVPMLAELNVSAVILGHSERYQHFGETPENVRARATAALEGGLTAVVCVGEREADYRAGRSEEVVLDMLRRSLPPPSTHGIGSLVIAYEPVWAIGTGLAATAEVAQSIHAAIRGELKEQLGDAVGEALPILYGGSVTPDNIAGYTAERDIAGALVGGASLDPDKFFDLITRGSKR
ncbi:MAG: triose-phosphate isomerase [Deltaproteobacteria bacterium]|nr:triose-phosphate isomerase [Deltaproteobacteria bacterium]